MTGRDAWGIIAPILGKYVDSSNPVMVEAYGLTGQALLDYDECKFKEMVNTSFDEWEAEESEELSMGPRISSLLEARGMTQRELATKCKITTVSMNRYIRSERMPSALIAKKIAKALGVSVDYLVNGKEGESK